MSRETTSEHSTYAELAELHFEIRAQLRFGDESPAPGDNERLRELFKQLEKEREVVAKARVPREVESSQFLLGASVQRIPLIDSTRSHKC